MVDNGCTVLDVIVEHPVYGQLTGQLQISSRYDVEQFLARVQARRRRPTEHAHRRHPSAHAALPGRGRVRARLRRAESGRSAAGRLTEVYFS